MSTRIVCGIAAFFGVCVLMDIWGKNDFVGDVLVVGAILCVAVLAVKCLTDEWIWRQ